MAWRRASGIALIAVLGAQAAQSEDGPPSPRAVAAFACLHKFAPDLDDHRSDAAAIGAVVASRCIKELELMAEEGADEETHNFLERRGFLEEARKHLNEFGTLVVGEERAKRD